MRRASGLWLGMFGGLALLSALGYLAVLRTTHAWFERDLDLRSRLAVVAARQSLSDHWSDPARLRGVLDDITHDERVMAVAACSPRGVLLASTADYPRTFGCRFEPSTTKGESTRALRRELSTGPVHITLSTIDSGAGRLGSIVLVHDIGFIARREASARNLLLAAFLLISLGAVFVAVLLARHARRRLAEDVQSALAGEPSTEFAPLVRDVRALAERLAMEHGEEQEARAGAWSPARLRATLKQVLEGERVVILANREPYIHEKTEAGLHVVHPASGLVTALEPVMRACSGVWVAHGSGSGDRLAVDARDRVRVPPGEESYSIRRVWLSEDEENGYYYGFSNEGLWPLCHVAHTRPVFRADDFDRYMKVNQRFAEAVCEEVEGDDPIILVQDYHFALAPRMIRERLPRATIITFLHVPWPNAERFGICPWSEELLLGLLGSSVVGFHTQQHVNNFIDSVDTMLESRIDRENSAVVQASQRTLVRPYPISIEWPVHWLASAPDVATARREIRRELGLTDDVWLGIGVDRMDYTKGIEERLHAVDQLLEHHPEFRGRFCFVQVAAPSRSKIGHYRELDERVVALAERINERWRRGDVLPIALIRRHQDPATVFRYYRAADVCYVSSLHDGMNLVAKEFVAARDDEQGVLVLSQFTGAARDLTEALIVNPYDIRRAGDALARALRMPRDEQRERMRSMRGLLSHFNVYRWAGRMLIDAAELRRKERLSGRFMRTASDLELVHT